MLLIFTSNPGQNFIPPGLEGSASSGGFNSSAASFNDYLKGFLPYFSPRQIAEVEALYPIGGSTETIANITSTYTRAGLVYRDIVLACPSYWLARAAHQKSYVGEYNISPATHASDTEWVFLPTLLLPCSTSSKFQILTRNSGTKSTQSKKPIP